MDKNRDVRDYILCDFLIDTPQIEIEIESTKPQIRAHDDFDVDIIKLNVYPMLLVNVLKGVFLKKEMVIVLDNEFLRGYIQQFLRIIFDETFSNEVVLLSRKTYSRIKKEYKKSIVVENSNIIQDKDKVLNQKKLKIEKNIVQKFFADNSSTSSVIIIKNEIKKVFILSKKIIEFKENLEPDKLIDSKMLIDYFKSELDIKIQIPYLKHLLEIIRTYFQVDIEITSDTIDFFKLLQ